MSDRLRLKTLIAAVVFFLFSMSGMLIYAHEKAIVITEGPHDVLQNQIDSVQSTQPQEQSLQKPRSFVFDANSQAGERLCIPLQDGVKAENVIIENRYMSKELRISVGQCEVEFYNTQAVYGDVTGIESGTYEETVNGVLMRFQLTDIFECTSVLDGNKLYIDLVPPAKIYEKIVVIDPVYSDLAASAENGSLAEKDLALDVAKRLKTKLDATDIKAYFTRLDDKEVENVERLGLVEEVGADFILSIGAAENPENSEKYGTEVVYNGNFFTPGLNSVVLADCALREVVIQISGRGNGLLEATENESVIWNAQVPAALLKVGYLSNKQEAALLSREDYREKIAEGIYQAILKVYEGEEN
ncbi:MAG: N-acetylmuramoyl-L-alanine amidase [Lachnospiraceae bacterium]|nr:N-acetylmuramoyl-L-alanine amidase [Lachnospiraceae bacterium]